MQTRNDAGMPAASTNAQHPDRQRGLASKIAAARARRNEATMTREDFMDDPIPEAPKDYAPDHQEFREELRAIIATDAVRAANEPGAPEIAEIDEPIVAAGPTGRVKKALYWIGCFLGIGAVAYGLSRPS